MPNVSDQLLLRPVDLSIGYTILVIRPSNKRLECVNCILTSLIHLLVVLDYIDLSFCCSRAQTLGWSKLVCGQNALTVSRYSTSPVVSSCCHR